MTILCMLVAVTAGNSNSGIPEQLKNLLVRLNPWKIVNNTQPVYLFQVTAENELLSMFFCIFSEYISYDDKEETVYRTLQSRFQNGSSIRRALNISLQVKDTPFSPTLLVGLLVSSNGKLPTMGPNDLVAFAEYQLPVHYADGRCLILGNPGQRGRSAGCSLWTTEKPPKGPPLCCRFLFFQE
uniref:Lipocalin/cytosolic fatty-acid binding domain-containing protein n=1 Tax=Amblyomma maculatum TaxID=34609 RepID=G3MSP5_AMBMU